MYRQTNAFSFTMSKKNISYHTIRLLHSNKSIIYTALFATDQSKIVVIYNYLASNCVYNNYMCVVKSYNFFELEMPVQSDNA